MVSWRVIETCKVAFEQLSWHEPIHGSDENDTPWVTKRAPEDRSFQKERIVNHSIFNGELLGRQI